MRDEIERFVASLAIPADRKAVVLAELLDHVESARETAAREGRDPDLAEREAIGDLATLRHRFESVEPAFSITRRAAFVRGVIAGTAIAIAIDRLQMFALGFAGALVALAFAVACAPPRVMDLLRAELRAKRVKGTLGAGLPIAAAVTYGYTVTSVPFLIWIGMIAYRGLVDGNTHVDIPWSAFIVMSVVYATLFVEALRARRVVA